MMTNDDDDNMNEQESDDEIAFAHHQIEHVLFPAMRRYGNFPEHLLKHIKEAADYKVLFKVFERC
jgi:hypothetical protein